MPFSSCLLPMSSPLCQLSLDQMGWFSLVSHQLTQWHVKQAVKGLAVPSTVQHMGIMCTEITLDRQTVWDTWSDLTPYLKVVRDSKSQAASTFAYTHTRLILLNWLRSQLQTHTGHSRTFHHTIIHNPLYPSDSNKRTHTHTHTIPDKHIHTPKLHLLALVLALFCTPTLTHLHTQTPLCPLQMMMMAWVWEVNGCLLLTTFTLDYSSRLVSRRWGHNSRLQPFLPPRSLEMSIWNWKCWVQNGLHHISNESRILIWINYKVKEII